MSASPSPWYRKSESESVQEQRTDPRAGLSHAEAGRRRASVGDNIIRRQTRRSAARILIAQFSNSLILILIVAAVVAGIVGEPQDIAAILAIVLLNTGLGFFQEFRAERAMEALRALVPPLAKVRRLGALLILPAHQIVPGDIVLLEAGTSVPADLRLIEAFDLRLDESALTGESAPVEKFSRSIPQHGLAIADQRNMAFKGTLVLHGRGTGVTVSTGMGTELGRVAELLRQEVEVSTPLQRRLGRFSGRLALVILGICLLMFLAGLALGTEPTLMFLTALSLAVAAIPEALPAMVTVTLALGARRMSRSNALIRRLAAVETLGSVTTICADKTGTLTQNRMQVTQAWVPGERRSMPLAIPPVAGDSAWGRLLQILAQSNDVTRDDRDELQGDPTERALLTSALQSGLGRGARETLDAKFPRIAEIPFSSERARMSTIHRVSPLSGEMRWVFTKGAPESVLPLCAASEAREQAREIASDMANDGLRVLALGFREIPGPGSRIDLDTVEKDLSVVGLVGLIDPPRPEATRALEICRAAGVKVVMITGDHPATAAAIARQLGIPREGRERVLTGRELATLSDEELARQVESIAVYARVAPEQKIRIVRALQAAGEITAMTGDGVNDAPALRRAEIGVAMGRIGTDVAREASSLVLLDDNFATIVTAIREGRRLYDNIRKFVRFALSGNSGELWTLFLAPLLGLPLPLLPIQILWVNLVTDGLPGLALAAEPAERDLMRRKPRPPEEGLFAHGLWQQALWVGLLIAAVTLGIQAYFHSRGDPHWRTMAFTILTFTQMGQILALRSERDSFFRQGFGSNPALTLTVTLSLGLQLCAVYVPGLQRVFKTQALTASELGVCVLAMAVVFLAVEAEKAFRRRACRGCRSPMTR